ncbi:MAG: acetyl-CoA carboxylase biotin carboxyl carrier protein [Spartobacteria bacterium]|nr:acetyl-CoA carboxylase biotin carboxyl carrier protein [Spartobacteria bacterium]
MTRDEECSMDIKEIRKVIGMMKENDLVEFEIEDQGFRMAIKRDSGREMPYMVSAPTAQPMMMAPQTTMSTMPAGTAVSAPAAEDNEEADWADVKSPIVGTFYRSPTPEADPYVTVGQTVEEDTVLCIIEAMKVMNEIKAEMSGVVRKVLVDNATPVEFDQPLFKIEKD